MDLKKTSEFHMTLQFLGDGIKNSDKIKKALSKVRFEPFRNSKKCLQKAGIPII